MQGRLIQSALGARRIRGPAAKDAHLELAAAIIEQARKDLVGRKVSLADKLASVAFFQQERGLFRLICDATGVPLARARAAIEEQTGRTLGEWRRLLQAQASKQAR